MKDREKIGVFLKSTAQATCKVTTASTQYLVNGSGPQSFVT